MDGKTKVRLEQDGSVLIVDEAATEPANHPEQGADEMNLDENSRTVDWLYAIDLRQS